MGKPRNLALLLLIALAARAALVDFELRAFPDSPVVFATASSEPAPGLPGRQFVTIRNDSSKSVAAVIFDQTAVVGSKTAIIAIERVSVVFAAKEKRRVSIAVGDVSQKLASGEAQGRPVLSLVAVEFLDGTQWNAPTGGQ